MRSTIWNWPTSWTPQLNWQPGVARRGAHVGVGLAVCNAQYTHALETFNLRHIQSMGKEAFAAKIHTK